MIRHKALSSSLPRIDTLLALAFLFVEKTLPLMKPHDNRNASSPETPPDVRAFLPGLSQADKQACDARLAWHASQSPAKQRRWFSQTLNRLRDAHTRLDEHIDASHIVEALRDEPPSVRAVIGVHLPTTLARALKLDVANSAVNAPTTEIMQIVRQAFLQQFVCLPDLAAPVLVDMLSGVELARTVRLLGVRETALACRGIAAFESVASFLRRFDAGDAPLILAHISASGDADSARIRIAEQVMHRMMSLEPDASAMLDRTGLYALAAAFAGRDDTTARYTFQKLPLDIAREFSRLRDESRATLPDAASRERFAEVETVAAEVRRVTLNLRRAPPVADVDNTEPALPSNTEP